ncbi:hypothetical protein J1614_012048 [Plenodomus biglobosus]|nr:hypothetical protein J1614_012048 [Plenodomus biglobosus]
MQGTSNLQACSGTQTIKNLQPHFHWPDTSSSGQPLWPTDLINVVPASFHVSASACQAPGFQYSPDHMENQSKVTFARTSRNARANWQLHQNHIQSLEVTLAGRSHVLVQSSPNRNFQSTKPARIAQQKSRVHKFHTIHDNRLNHANTYMRCRECKPLRQQREGVFPIQREKRGRGGYVGPPVGHQITTP